MVRRFFKNFKIVETELDSLTPHSRGTRLQRTSWLRARCVATTVPVGGSETETGPKLGLFGPNSSALKGK